MKPFRAMHYSGRKTAKQITFEGSQIEFDELSTSGLYR